MRRPLDWIVVSISLMVLFANRMLAEPARPALAAHTPGALDGLAQVDSPFAYIREDGTQVFLPVEPRTPWSASQVVYSWSTPLLPEARPARLISASPSSR